MNEDKVETFLAGVGIIALVGLGIHQIKAARRRKRIEKLDRQIANLQLINEYFESDEFKAHKEEMIEETRRRIGEINVKKLFDE